MFWEHPLVFISLNLDRMPIFGPNFACLPPVMCKKNITKASHIKEWYREYLSGGLFPIKRYFNRQTDRGKLTVVVVRWFLMTGASSKLTGSEIRTEPLTTREENDIAQEA